MRKKISLTRKNIVQKQFIFVITDKSALKKIFRKIICKTSLKKRLKIGQRKF